MTRPFTFLTRSPHPTPDVYKVSPKPKQIDITESVDVDDEKDEQVPIYIVDPDLEVFGRIYAEIIKAMKNKQPIMIKYSPKIAPSFEKAYSVVYAEMTRRERVRQSRRKDPSESAPF
jgi:hypothetical protein